MTAEPELPAEAFGRLMRSLLHQPPTEAEQAVDPEAAERAKLRRDVLDLLAGRAPEQPKPPAPTTEPDPAPVEPRDEFAALIGQRLGIATTTTQED